MRPILIAVGLLCTSNGAAWSYMSYTNGYELQRVCNGNSDAERQIWLGLGAHRGLAGWRMMRRPISRRNGHAALLI